jgi:restriction endonuclease S subunit
MRLKRGCCSSRASATLAAAGEDGGTWISDRCRFIVPNPFFFFFFFLLLLLLLSLLRLLFLTRASGYDDL